MANEQIEILKQQGYTCKRLKREGDHFPFPAHYHVIYDPQGKQVARSDKASQAWENLIRRRNKIGAFNMDNEIPKIVVEVRGGIVQEVYASAPVNVYVLDWDHEGFDHDDSVPEEFEEYEAWARVLY